MFMDAYKPETVTTIQQRYVYDTAIVHTESLLHDTILPYSSEIWPPLNTMFYWSKLVKKKEYSTEDGYVLEIT